MCECEEVVATHSLHYSLADSFDVKLRRSPFNEGRKRRNQRPLVTKADDHLFEFSEIEHPHCPRFNEVEMALNVALFYEELAFGKCLCCRERIERFEQSTLERMGVTCAVLHDYCKDTAPN